MIVNDLCERVGWRAFCKHSALNNNRPPSRAFTRPGVSNAAWDAAGAGRGLTAIDDACMHHAASRPAVDPERTLCNEHLGGYGAEVSMRAPIDGGGETTLKGLAPLTMRRACLVNWRYAAGGERVATSAQVA